MYCPLIIVWLDCVLLTCGGTPCMGPINSTSFCVHFYEFCYWTSSWQVILAWDKFLLYKYYNMKHWLGPLEAILSVTIRQRVPDWCVYVLKLILSGTLSQYVTSTSYNLYSLFWREREREILQVHHNYWGGGGEADTNQGSALIGALGVKILWLCNMIVTCCTGPFVCTTSIIQFLEFFNFNVVHSLAQFEFSTHNETVSFFDIYYNL